MAVFYLSSLVSGPGALMFFLKTDTLGPLGFRVFKIIIQSLFDTSTLSLINDAYRVDGNG